MYARQRLPGTCGWIFNHASYRAWLSPNGPACLWIHGLPGAGKTVLTSSALEELEKLETPAFAVISCFIDEVPGQGYSLQSLLALLSCKLSKYRRQPAPESNLSCIHEGYYHGRPSMSFADVKRHLGTLLANIDPNIQITLLFDGPDNEEWFKGILIDEIIQANLDRDRSCHLKCCISSRTPFTAAARLDQVINVSMNEERGVYQDLYQYTIAKVAALPCLSAERNQSQANLIEQLCSYANGTFLWVALVMHYSPSLESLSAKLQTVHSVPSDIESIYRQALQSIPLPSFGIAHRVFLWLIAACRPLKLTELAEAITVNNTQLTGSFESQDCKGPPGLSLDVDLAHICGGLIVVTEDGFVRLVHSSVRNYLLSQHGRNPPTCTLPAAHKLITHTCLTYLRSGQRMRSFRSYGRWAPVKAGEVEHSSAICSYAFTYWSLHYSQVEAHSKTLVGSLQQALSTELNNLADTLGLSGTTRSASTLETALRISAGYGFTSLVKLYLEMGVDVDRASCSRCETPLHFAVARGRTKTIALLLDRGASVELRGSLYGETPLYLAAASGFDQAVKLLLEHGANPQVASTSSTWTPLQAAAAHGHLEVMVLLLDFGIDINSAITATKDTPLHLAARQGHLHVVRYLLDSRRTSLSETELYQSIVRKPYFQAWSEEVLTNSENGKGFVWEGDARCSAEQDMEKLRSFAKGYTDVNFPAHEGRTALHYAASNGHEAIVRLLLERGADPEGGSHGHHTALRAAAENGHVAVVKLLLIHTSNMTTHRKDWRTILEHSAENGHQAVADLLLWQAFGWEIASQDFKSAMLCVANEVKEDLVQGILRRKRPRGDTETGSPIKK